MDPSALGTVAVELEQMKMRSDYQDNKLEAQDEKLGKIEKLLSSLLEQQRGQGKQSDSGSGTEGMTRVRGEPGVPTAGGALGRRSVRQFERSPSAERVEEQPGRPTGVEAGWNLSPIYPEEQVLPPPDRHLEAASPGSRKARDPWGTGRSGSQAGSPGRRRRDREGTFLGGESARESEQQIRPNRPARRWLNWWVTNRKNGKYSHQ